MKGYLNTRTWRDVPTYMIANLIMVVHMDIISRLLSFQRLYTIMSLLSSMVSAVVVISPSIGDGWLGQTILINFLCQYIFDDGYRVNVLISFATSIQGKIWYEGYDNCYKFYFIWKCLFQTWIIWRKKIIMTCVVTVPAGTLTRVVRQGQVYLAGSRTILDWPNDVKMFLLEMPITSGHVNIYTEKNYIGSYLVWQWWVILMWRISWKF